MIRAQDRPGYQAPPVYRQGQSPPFTVPSEEVGRKPVNVEATLARWQKPQPQQILQPLIDRELALIEKHVTTPYTNAYVRSFDGALMIELPGWGTFVSETWAVAAGYVSEPSKSPEAVAARQEARQDRKEGQKVEKQKAVVRKQKRVAKARQKEMMS